MAGTVLGLFKPSRWQRGARSTSSKGAVWPLLPGGVMIQIATIPSR
jgi:hypothetical protein